MESGNVAAAGTAKRYPVPPLTLTALDQDERMATGQHLIEQSGASVPRRRSDWWKPRVTTTEEAVILGVTAR